MRTLQLRRSRLAWLVVVCLLATAPVLAQTPVPSPEQFFGFPMGAEKKLAAWDKIVEYFQVVDRGSDRVLVQELGRTTMGKPYIMAVVSAPETLKDLARYQEMQKKLADPRRTTDEEADRIAREGKAVFLLGMNVHSTEIGNSQMVNKLIYKLATENSPWVDHVLRNVIVLIIPSENPDGQQMVVDWYAKNLGTPYENSPTPELYHKYVGHDNNRDAYMLTQVETQHLARVTYTEWLPEVYLDKHQMGNNRARIFVPPYKNPPNPNVDPILWAETNLLGQAMATKLAEAGKTGVIWGEQYTGFWQGANSTQPWWHNMIALLTETASSQMGHTVRQEMADPSAPPRAAEGGGRGGFGDRDPGAPVPAPTDVQYRMNYLQPWLGGSWALADVVDYQFISALGVLEGIANNKEMLKRNYYLMNKRTIEQFGKGSPYAFIVPKDQRDPAAVAKLLQLIQAQAGEVSLAEAPFTAGGRDYPAGTFILLLAQPHGRFIKDLLEPQKYPDIRWPSADAPIDRPYDVTAWSLGMLMGVEAEAIEGPFAAKLKVLGGGVQAPAGRVNGTGSTYVLPHELNTSAIAMNRLFKEGADISWARDEIIVNGRKFAPGAILVSKAKPATVAKIADELKIPIEAGTVAATGRLVMKAPRIALYEPWGGNMDAGWTRWLLEQHEFPYTWARNADLRQPNLNERFDVIIFAEMNSGQIVRGSQARNVRPEYKGGIGDEGVKNLREFVQNGGTIITIGNAAVFAIEQLGAPFENTLRGLDQNAFFCPGSILRVSVDTRHPIGYGMPEEADAMFIGNGAYVGTPAFPSVTTATIVRYPQTPLLRSGWIIGDDKLRGKGAVMEAATGRGRIILHGFKVQNRAQTWGTFKLFFNSIFYGPAVAGRPAMVTTTEAAAGR